MLINLIHYQENVKIIIENFIFSFMKMNFNTCLSRCKFISCNLEDTVTKWKQRNVWLRLIKENNINQPAAAVRLLLAKSTFFTITTLITNNLKFLNSDFMKYSTNLILLALQIILYEDFFLTWKSLLQLHYIFMLLFYCNF